MNSLVLSESKKIIPQDFFPEFITQKSKQNISLRINSEIAKGTKLDCFVKDDQLFYRKNPEDVIEVVFKDEDKSYFKKRGNLEWYMSIKKTLEERGEVLINDSDGKAREFTKYQYKGMKQIHVEYKSIPIEITKQEQEKRNNNISKLAKVKMDYVKKCVVT